MNRCREIVSPESSGAGRGPAARHMAWQLAKCGTSIGANAEEAQEGQTKADFIAKMSVSRKEAREAAYWLRLAVATGAASADETAWAIGECAHLLTMLRSAIRTAQASPRRHPDPV